MSRTSGQTTVQKIQPQGELSSPELWHWIEGGIICRILSVKENTVKMEGVVGIQATLYKDIRMIDFELRFQTVESWIF